MFELIRLLLESDVIVRSGSMSWRIDEVALAKFELPATYDELVDRRLAVMDRAERDLIEKAAVIGDTFWLDVQGVPGSKPGLILRGNNQLAGGLGAPVGDGLLCVAGQSARSHVQITSGGSTSFTDINGGTSADDLSIAVDTGDYVINDPNLAITTSIPTATRPDGNTGCSSNCGAGGFGAPVGS